MIYNNICSDCGCVLYFVSCLVAFFFFCFVFFPCCGLVVVVVVVVVAKYRSIDVGCEEKK